MHGVATQTASHMPQVPHFLIFIGVLVAWVVLFESAHLFLALLRHDRLIGWAIGPFGITTLFLREPPKPYIVLEALFPALVSGVTLYIGLFTSLVGLVILPPQPLLIIAVISLGVLITSTGDCVNGLCDLLYPLWGEARILRNIQVLRASWATIHFTPFGLSYLRDHFDSTPSDLLQAF
ncbi:MAG: hypothetical protein M3Y81_26290 [Chloroflexota bacterium]|nr:hypothetical protein [Chloroflexota bacterium]